MRFPALRNAIDGIKPNFIGDGKFSKWFPIFDAVENFVFSSKTKTKNPIHVRDAVDIQRVMVIVWLSTFPAMFFGMYNVGNIGLDYIAQAGLNQTNDWHHFLISFTGYEQTFFNKIWFGASYFIPIYVVTFAVGITWEIIFAVINWNIVGSTIFN